MISSGLFRFIFLFILLITIPVFIPSSLLAVTQNESFKKNPSLISSIDPDKTEYFQNKLDKYVGTPYIRGGITEKGFDCSGFVRQIYMEFFGIDLPHRSSSQSSLPFMQKVNKDELVTGDLIFFSTTGKNKRINHVGIYLSDGRFIHAAKGGVTISSLDNTYWKARFFVAKRVENDDIWKSIAVEKETETELLAMYNNYSSRFNPFANLDGNQSAFDTYPYYRDYSSNTLSLGYEITWSASIANGSITPKFTAFQEYRPFKSYPEDISSLFKIKGFDLATASDSSDQGMRFATVFGSDDDGLLLTPSFTYYDTGYDLKNRRLQRYTYGLDLKISPDNKSWLFALGMQYSGYTYSYNSASITDSNEFRSPMNMSFTYLQKLNKSAYLSFTGEVVRRYEPTSEGGIFDQWKNERRSMFLFNYNY